MRKEVYMKLSHLGSALLAAAIIGGVYSFSGSSELEASPPSSKDQLKEAEKVNDVPSFSLAWSEYPSWSVFGVAHEARLINGKKGEMGRLERKWNVDIEL